MPGLTVLRAATQFGLDAHYWGEEGRGDLVDQWGEEELHKLLECYMSLKVY